ncbi:MAG: hypothetical protein R2838_17790 [Caldilineaceae bacterium]
MGGGSLTGMLLAGSLPRPAPPLWAAAAHNHKPARRGPDHPGSPRALRGWKAAAAFVMGISSGYVNILYITWLQTCRPQYLMGRIMSLSHVCRRGVDPTRHDPGRRAMAAWNLTVFFCIAGALLVVITLLVRHPAGGAGIGVAGVGKGVI